MKAGADVDALIYWTTKMYRTSLTESSISPAKHGSIPIAIHSFYENVIKVDNLQIPTGAEEGRLHNGIRLFRECVQVRDLHTESECLTRFKSTTDTRCFTDPVHTANIHKPAVTIRSLPNPNCYVTMAKECEPTSSSRLFLIVLKKYRILIRKLSKFSIPSSSSWKHFCVQTYLH
jgi:hypothetical protein